MYPAPIEAYFAPKTIEEALQNRADAGDDAVFIAGGMSLMQAMRARLMTPRVLIDLNEVEELSGLARGPRGVTVRPLTRYRELAKTSALRGALQALGDAAATVGDRQVRNAGTIGGNLCWNRVASCMPSACLCLDATLVLTSLAGGARVVPIDAFLIGPLETALREDELLTEINFPASRQRGVGSAYEKLGATVDGLPIVGIAASVEVDEAGVCTHARFSVGGVLPTAQRFDGVGEVLRSRPGTAKAFAEAAGAAAEAIETQSDHLASAHYRKVLIRTLGRDVLAEAHARATGG
ncbi:MAG: FAD binding domain-containing protein [Rhodospirillales bacterium]|nr:FAD binding domain-containing protein [Rhodospirillales bacterium]MDE0382228.1 FAD binding domain-containing protein [Rhodospirillales bacterium]